MRNNNLISATRSLSVRLAKMHCTLRGHEFTEGLQPSGGSGGRTPTSFFTGGHMPTPACPH